MGWLRGHSGQGDCMEEEWRVEPRTDMGCNGELEKRGTPPLRAAGANSGSCAPY